MWRENLRRLIEQHAGGNMKALSRRAGLGDTAVRDILKEGGVENPGIGTIEKLMDAMNLPLIMVFDNYLTEEAPRSAPIAGRVAAGIWFEMEASDSARDLVPFVPGRWSKFEQKAWRVYGPSMDEAGIAEGDFAITVDYWEARTFLQDGDIVVIERTLNGGLLRERSVKEARVMPATIEFWPRSRDPKFSEPVIINRGEEKGGLIDVVGLVIGIFRPMRN